MALLKDESPSNYPMRAVAPNLINQIGTELAGFPGYDMKKINDMDYPVIEKAKTFAIIEIVDYVPNSVVVKTIMKKTTGNISAVALDSGQVVKDKISPYDTFIQVIEGKAEIIIDDIPNELETGQSIIIPAHTYNTIKANVRFKMLATIIKSGYEDFA